MERHLTVFHSLEFLGEIRRSPGRKVWVPDAPSSSVYIEHLLELTENDGVVLHLEDIFPDIKEEYSKTDIQAFSVSHLDLSSKKVSRIAFYPQSDTLAVSAQKIYRNLDPETTWILTPQKDTEGVRDFLTSGNIPHEIYRFKTLRRLKPDALVLFNDWTKEAQRIMAHCHLLGIPVICIQESVIDFGDSSRRMQHADYAFVQGSSTFSELVREVLFITGNPRYVDLTNNKPRNPDDPVLINCNFTYDIHENVRYNWLDQITKQLDDLQIDYQITQHPRDRGDLSRYKNARKISTGSVHDMIRSSSVLITRFSSLIHEALIMGVPVIYHNPHRESMQYDFQCNDIFLQMTYTDGDLKDAILNLRKKEYFEGLESYLAKHCLTISPAPTTNIAFLLANSSLLESRFRIIDLVRLIIFMPFIRNVYYWVKGIFTRSK